MKARILLIFCLFLSINVMGQGTITRKKKTETKTEQKTEHKAKQKPAPTPKPKPTPTPKQEKTCNTCGKVLSKCTYNGQHPAPEAAGYDVEFSCNVSSASLYIDGNANGSASGTRFLKTGSHSIKVTANGYEDYTSSFNVNRQNTSFSITLQKIPEPDVKTTGTINGHEWVDLGLSVKWATCNVGTSSPSDYGGYYAWGETTTKSSYDWDNCFDCINPKKVSYNSGWGTYKHGGQTHITPTSGHDAARENWGGTWRMPTDAENEELCKKCKWTWTSQGGHNGYKVTGPNGNSIFLPAAGWRDGTVTYCVGEFGNYWSSTLSSSYSGNAHNLYFRSGNHNTGINYRRLGRSVRPVTE